MFEFAQSFVLANPLEFYTAVIATIGVAFWYTDRRSMKAALHAAREYEMATLRLKRHEIEASVERSFATLQLKCQAKRDDWRNHHWRSGAMLSPFSQSSKEEKQILHVERTGGSLLNQFKASAPDPDCSDTAELEAYFAGAGRASLQIERLASQLSEPQTLHR